MKKFRKIWNDETNGFLAEHKDMKRKEIHEAFLARFPDSDVTFTGLCNQLSRLGLRPHLKHGSTRRRPLYSEQVKKGYIRIKVAEPNVWISKAKWVYMETHPWEDFTERSNYVFLDGDNRNFAPENIERVPLRLMSLYSQEGGVVAGHPELTRLRIALAKMKAAQLTAGDKAGLVVRYGGYRVFRDDVNRRAREYRMNPEVRRKHCERVKAYRERLRKEDPVKFEEMARRQKEYQKEWYRRKKAEKG